MRAGELVARFGGHPSSELGIELGAAGGPERWLVASCLFGGRTDDAVALASARALEAAGLALPARIARAEAAALEALLARAGHPSAEVSARRLWRVCDSLVRHHGGSLDRLVSACDTLEDLASSLARLAPGFGAASVARFLRPLRDCWIQAREAPLQPAARAAAIHLGMLTEREDCEGEPGALRAALRAEAALCADSALRAGVALGGETEAPALADVEFALARIGAIACARGRVARCPLGGACPLRARSGTADDPPARWPHTPSE